MIVSYPKTVQFGDSQANTVKFEYNDVSEVVQLPTDGREVVVPKLPKINGKTTAIDAFPGLKAYATAMLSGSADSSDFEIRAEETQDDRTSITWPLGSDSKKSSWTISPKQDRNQDYELSFNIIVKYYVPREAKESETADRLKEPLKLKIKVARSPLVSLEAARKFLVSNGLMFLGFLSLGISTCGP